MFMFVLYELGCELIEFLAVVLGLDPWGLGYVLPMILAFGAAVWWLAPWDCE